MLQYKFEALHVVLKNFEMLHSRGILFSVMDTGYAYNDVAFSRENFFL
ncbi:hypothetical protein SLEP1_g26077 [Rubroshorea leprosula]|uniref:Uncharacterized protein n=1 Tax=Rubroshorea leprosula TaxID=152421 RepID=A0AAV5JKM0_9ROSI|nr:hypothetical protein SLEP1_g26077 [Rubroshorea leprosula]